MKWRILLVVVLAVLAIAFFFGRGQQWWSGPALFSIAGGILFERHENRLEAEAEETGEDRGEAASLGLFFLCCCGAFAIGIGGNLHLGWHWWAIFVCLGDSVVFIVAALVSLMATEEGKRKAYALTHASEQV